MKNFFFSIPDRDSSIFRCEVKDDDLTLYTREVHVYDKLLSEEMNVIILTKKMAQTLEVEEKFLIEPIRLAVVLGESTWIPTELE